MNGGDSEEQQDGDIVLISRICLKMAGPLGFRGELKLTTASLSFVPHAALDRWVGAKEWRVGVEEISSAELVGFQKALLVKSPAGKDRFIGQGAEQLFRRLRSLLQQRDGNSASFAPGERVFVQGLANCYVGNHLAVSGELLVTSRLLRFEPRRSIERFLLREGTTTVAVEDILDVQRVGIERRLHITTRDRVLKLSGEACTEAFGWLKAMVPDELGAGIAEVVGRYDVDRVHGRLVTTGQIVLSSERLVFVLLGRLNALARFHDETVPFSEVACFGLTGWPKSQLWICSTAGERLIWELEQAAERFNELADLMLGHQLSTSDRRGSTKERAAKVLRSVDLELGATEKVKRLSRGLYWLDDATTCDAWLILTQQRVVLVRYDESGEPSYREFAPHEIKRDEISEDSHGRRSLRFRAKGDDRVCVTLAEGSAAVEAFFTGCGVSRLLMPRWSQPPEPLEFDVRFSFNELEPPPSHNVNGDELVGDANFMRIVGADNEVLAVRSGAGLEVSKSGRVLMARGVDADALKSGTEVEVTVALPEGLYSFDTLVAEQTEEGEMLPLQRPAHIRSFERRTFFRQPMNVPMTVQYMAKDADGSWKPVGEREPALCVDLSRGGLAMECDEELQQGEHLFCTLPARLKKHVVEVECVRKVATEAVMGSWRYGVQFVSPSEAILKEVQELIDSRVRERWRERGVQKESGLQVAFESSINGWVCAVEVDPSSPQAVLSLRREVDADPDCPTAELVALICDSALRFSPAEELRLTDHVGRLARLAPGSSVVIAEGMEPLSGHAGQVLWQVPIDQPPSNRITDGNVDHRAVERFIHVVPGDILCELTDPHYGLAGRDVFGEPIPPPPPDQLPVKIGEGIRFDHDERLMLAEHAGCVDFDGERLSVRQVRRVEGDVDYHVGNIDFDGHVLVTGNVLAGFEVRATGSIHVEGMVDSAVLTAGENLYVAGGIVGHAESPTVVGGELRARYLNGTIIYCAGDVVIERQIRNCLLYAGASVAVSRGGIVGGTTRAGGGIQAESIGSGMCVETHVAVGVALFDSERHQHEREEIDMVCRDIQHIGRELGPLLGDPEQVEALGPRERRRFRRRKARLDAHYEHLRELETHLAIGSSAAPGQVATLQIGGGLFPNSSMQFGAFHVAYIESAQKGSARIHYDVARGTLVRDTQG